MAYGVVHKFVGGTEAQYRAVVAVVHPSDGSLPPGQIRHDAGPTDDGWLIVAIHDSKQSWESFRDDTLAPRLRAGIDGGFSGPPEEWAFEVTTEAAG